MTERIVQDYVADRGESAPIDAAKDSRHANGTLFRALHRGLRGRYLWAGLLGLALGVAGGYVGWKSQVPMYRGEGLIYIEPSLPSAQDPLGLSVLPMFKGFVALQVRLLNSSTVTQMAMETPVWQKTGKGREPEVVEQFTERRAILHSSDTQHIQIQFIDEKPGTALAGVQALMQAYESKSADQNSSDALLAKAKSQSDALAASSKDLANQLLRLGAEYGGEDGVQLRHVASLNQLLEATAALERTLSLLANHVDPIDEQQPPAPKSERELAIEHPHLMDARQRLDLLELEAAQLLESSGEKNSALVSLRQKIKVLQKFIDGFVEEWNRRLLEEWNRRKGRNSGVQSMAELKEQEASLVKRLQVLQAENQNFVKLRVDMGGLKAALEEQGRKLDQVRALRDHLSAQVVGTGRIRIQDPGTLPTMPFRDRRMGYGSAGGVLGFVLGVLVVLLFGVRNRKLKYTDDVGSSLSKIRLLGLLPALPADLSDPQGSEIAVHCVHQIRTLLQLGHAREKGSCICITGPGVGSGKTTLSVALGLSFARSGSRTLLIDADLTGRGLTRRIGQMLLSRVRRVAGEADKTKARSPTGNEVADSSSHLLEPLVPRDRSDARPDIDELSDLLVRTVERIGMEAARSSGQIADLFALTDLRLSREARTELAARLASIQPASGQEQEAEDVVPRAVTELHSEHPEFNGTPLDNYLFPTGTALLRLLPLRGLGGGGGVSVATISRILSRVRGEFDIVLVDTGPVLGALETPVVAAQADSVVFVVSPGDHRPDAERSVGKLQEVGARMAGLVFNRAHPKDVIKASGSYKSLTSRREVI